VKKFLKANKLAMTDVAKIAVRVGPGYFSRVRSGVVAANALAYALNVKIVPVKGEVSIKQIEKASGQGMVAPVYGGKPNITKPKR
jgi:tRNA A37 threonylcarbamoyladenosine modification protein TsaB